jgi:transcriptional regulator with XRE-family HTH domain
MTQPGWSARLVRVVAGEIKRHRERFNWSAQRLADETAKLGHPIQRSVLANLESGRRETVTVPELLILAEALEVSPLELLLPLGQADTIEILPGIEVSVLSALMWIESGNPLVDTNGVDAMAEPNAVTAFRGHATIVAQWRSLKQRAAAVRQSEGDGAEAEQLDLAADRTLETLWTHRSLMRARGLTPPKLLPPLDAMEQLR